MPETVWIRRGFDRKGVLTMIGIGMFAAVLWFSCGASPGPSPTERPEDGFAAWLQGLTEYDGPGMIIVSATVDGGLLLTFECLADLEPRALAVYADRVLTKHVGRVFIGPLRFLYDERRHLIHVDIIDENTGFGFRRVLRYRPEMARARAIDCCDCPDRCAEPQMWCCLVPEVPVCACMEDVCLKLCRKRIPGGAEPED